MIDWVIAWRFTLSRVILFTAVTEYRSLYSHIYIFLGERSFEYQ